MKVVLVPGSRNEELINRIKQIKTAYPDEAWEQLLLQQDGVIMVLNLSHRIFDSLNKFPDMMIVKRIVGILRKHRTHIV